MNRCLLVFGLCLASLSLPASAALPDPQRFSVVLEMGDVAQARQWLDEGLDPNFEGRLIGTGLMIGAWEGNIPLMELFLARGADLQRVNRFGETALMLAAWKNRREAMRWLIERGAQPNRPEREWTALHYATFGGHVDLVEDLLKAGANINARSTNGSTVVMMAAREGHGALARRLLAAGANPAIKNDFEDDAVSWAMTQGHYDIAKSFTSAENFAELARAAARLKAPVRSVPIPDVVEEHLRMARLAESQGKRDEALAAYRKALASLKAQEAAGKGSAGTAKNARTATPAKPPSALVISARRTSPEQQTMGFVAPPSAAPTPAPAPPKAASGAAAPSVEDLLELARNAEATGQRQEAIRLYRQAAAKLKQMRE